MASSSGTDKHRYAITLADATRPIYYIKNISNGKYLRLDANYKTTFNTTNVLANSQYWFVIPKGTGYQLLNFAAWQRALTNFGRTVVSTTNCGADYLDYGNVWEFVDQTVVISYFYDNGFKSRYSSTLSTQVSDIQSKQTQIAGIISNVFGISVITEAPTNMESYADSCTGYASSCPESHATSTSCKNNHGAVDLSLVHHKNSSALLRNMYNNKSVANKHKLYVMFSGHVPCGKYEGVHRTNHIEGVAIRSLGTATVYRNGTDSTSDLTITRNKYVALHEISHCLGAKTGDGLTPDTIHEDGKCIMSYEWNEDYLYRNWASQSSTIYCSNCLTLIQNYLSNS